AANDAIEIHWEQWGRACDLGGRMSFTHLLRLVAKAVARDGEALVRLVRGRDLPYGLALQVLDIDRLDESLNRQGSGNAIRQGVELDSSGRAVALWVKTRHPGENYAVSAAEYERVPAADILHVFLPERPEQVRGYTWLHAVLLDSAQLAKFIESAVIAARVGASKIAALERSEDSLDQAALLGDSVSNGNLSMNVEAGELFELPPGYTLNSWNPDYPHQNFDSFLKACLRGIASGLDVAAHNLTGDMTEVNYSSARIAELAEREEWMALQSWFIASVVRPIFKEWLSIALLRGDVTFPMSGKALPFDRFDKFYLAARFQGRRWQWVDPRAEVEAAQLLIENGLSSRTEIAAAQGREFDDVVDELEQEEKRLRESGLRAPPPAAEPAEPAELPEADPEAEERSHARKMEITRAAAPAVNVTVTPPNITFNQAAIRVDVPPAEVTVTPPVIHNEISVEPTPIQIAAPEIRNEITVEPTPVTLEANIDMPPVQVQLPSRRTETLVERDANGNISRATQLEQDA
ncbi:MAG: phage portal protein, partial [Thiobacillaceae bacterium]|nr:phage portal protein [Thiobacillaceae bacterium]